MKKTNLIALVLLSKLLFAAEVDGVWGSKPYSLQRSFIPPRSITFALRDSAGKTRRVELRAIDPENNPVLYRDTLRNRGSLIGFEISIPFLSESPSLTHPDQRSGLAR